MLGNPVGLDVRGPVDLEQFLVLRAGGPDERILAHVQAVGLAARDHQERLVDQLDPVGGIPAHQVQQVAGGVLEGRAGVCMRAPVILVALTIHFERQRGNLLVRHVGVARIKHLATSGFLGAGGGGLLQSLLDGVQLRIGEAVAAHAAGVEHAQRGHRLEAFVALRSSQGVATAAAKCR